MAQLIYETVSGKGVVPYIDDLARLRISVFAEYPYLYDGGLTYEREYLSHLARCESSFLVIAKDKDLVVGCSTALPLAEADADFQEPFQRHGYDLKEVFYFGESVLDPHYRGYGAGRVFFEQREAAARAGKFRWASFCAVERPDEHPRRPVDYSPLDRWWQRLGFVKHPELKANFDWKEIGQPAMSTHPMSFWLKELV
ncbi:MAG: GNAT family N-acetyltransferase [Verrucomicrobiota bacterium JB022]|nr:GNAT family N-acetyltransferase [Verrucomicrobiota bacterium JB022]